jgi:hypothetical protein
VTRDRWATLVVVALTAILFHPACNLFFRCGCTLFGLAARCNIHAAGPHCPWCTRPITALVSALIAAAGGWLALGLARRRVTTLAPLVAAGLAGTFAALLLAAAGTRLYTGYPYFLFR